MCSKDPHPSSSKDAIRGRILVIDQHGTSHARRIARCAEIGKWRPHIRWLEPSTRLPHELQDLPDIDAIAVPLSVRGAGRRDRFTLALADSLQALRERGVPVFVSAGSHRAPNPLAAFPRLVSVGPLHGRRHPAQLHAPVPGGTGSSGAAVRAASLYAMRRFFSLVRLRPLSTPE